ncbi:PAS domain S-box protein [Azonexus sp.]|jgi:PAS domain S-box-containing protein|uniref:PAS domain-containing protein n=1 Tax=Azonexus sp. TaxID=1872668 RepID=UPI0028229F39|nr:PAS domain S-box protein [Azonexus sp.]MDR1994189.1 PAS domain S-box protein [Azonexus sp.]
MSDSNQADIDRLCIEQMADALICSDHLGIILRWNAAATVLFGHSPAQALGQSLDLIIPENLRAAHWSAFDRAMETGVTRLNGRATVTRALTADGGAVYVEMSFAVVTDGNGKAIGSVAIARDATKRRQEERELRERLAALERGAA